MIANLQPYPAYKDSGLPWLGKMPAHWSTNRLRHACAMLVSNVDKHTKDGELPVRLCNYVDVYKNERIRHQLRFMRASASEDEVEHFRLQTGDVLITKDSEEWNDIGVPSLVEYEAPDLVCGYHLAILRSRSGFVSGGYLLRALQCHQIAGQFHIEAHGVTRYGLSHGAIRGVGIPVPPPEEQEYIVRFLDYANGRLESAIRAKRKVIALLHEQKQAIIHHAVTRGLDHAVPLKPSGIPWLGEIPEHWEVRPLKQLLARMDYGTSENGRGEGRVRMLTMGHIRDGKILFPRKGSLDAVPPGLLLEKNDLLFNRTNSPELVGKVGLFAGDASDEITFASYLVRLRARSEHSPFWLNYLLNSTGFWSYARSQALVSLHQANLNSTRYGQMVLPVPSTRAEQDGIVDLIRSQAGEIERAISRLEREIELLREYRTRLVADVVTGKLDVRGVTLPAEPPAALAAETIEQSSGEPEEAEDPSD